MENKEITTQASRLLVSSDDPVTGILWDSAKFEHLQRVAKMFSESGMVPEVFKKNPAACAVGLQLAQQLQVSPFMLFQKLYVIQGKPAIEAQLAIAVANQRGVFTAPIEFVFSGDNAKKTRACTARAVLSKTKTPVEITIDWSVVEGEGWSKKGGSKWLTMPDQMFRYRSAMWLIRTYCPEVLFGMYSADELDDMRIIDITPQKTGKPPMTIDDAFATMSGSSGLVEDAQPETSDTAPDTTTQPGGEADDSLKKNAEVDTIEAIVAEIESYNIPSGPMTAYAVRALGENKKMSEWTLGEAQKVLEAIRKMKGIRK